MYKPLLSLVMIVKDEAASIRNVLETVKPHVTTWTILDTGSTDGTQDIVREVMKDRVGLLFEEPFVDFARTRNRVMDLDHERHHAVFQLMLSGDEYLKGGSALCGFLEGHRNSLVDCFFTRILIDGSSSLHFPRVLRSGSDWRYEGVVHESPVHPLPNAPVAIVPMEAVIEHDVSDPEKRFANIWEKHIPLLQAELEENPESERALHYLAQSYESLFQFFSPQELVTHAMTAMSLRLRRLAIKTGTDEERGFARMRYLDDARLTGIFTDAELYARGQSFMGQDPKRPEMTFLCAELAVKAAPADQVYKLAAKAADLAAQAAGEFRRTPLDTSCGWKAHRLAAVVARQLAAKQKDAAWSPLVRYHIDEGLAAGGPKVMFEVLEKPIQTDAQPSVRVNL